MGKYESRKSHPCISLTPAVILALKAVSGGWGVGEAGTSDMNFISSDNVIYGLNFITILSYITMM